MSIREDTNVNVSLNNKTGAGLLGHMTKSKINMPVLIAVNNQ